SRVGGARRRVREAAGTVRGPVGDRWLPSGGRRDPRWGAGASPVGVRPGAVADDHPSAALTVLFVAVVFPRTPVRIREARIARTHEGGTRRERVERPARPPRV